MLVAEVAATSVTAGLADLGGTVLREISAPLDPTAGPELTLERVEALFDDLVSTGQHDDPPVRGIGIGVPGPVATDTARPIGALFGPGWPDYPVRERLARRYDVPTWVDNEVNTMALGEVRAGRGQGLDDVLFIKIGTGIGGAVISSGSLVRGSRGFAGELGHVIVSDDDTARYCWCGQAGCLTQIAGARAIARRAEQAAEAGRSPILAAILAEVGSISPRKVFAAAEAGDSTSIELLTIAGESLGQVASTLVCALNPAAILIGGGVVGESDPLMTAFAATVRRRSLPGAVAELDIREAALGNSAGLIGAAHLVVDELLSPRRLALWSDRGTTVGLADVIHRGIELGGETTPVPQVRVLSQSG